MSENAYNHCIALDDFRQSALLDSFPVSSDTLDDGQIMVRIDKLALTSNSLSYVIAGKSGLMRFLDLFPAAEGKGRIPCWGFGDVLHSKHPDIAEGERLYGFFPVASHLICTPGKIRKSGFLDVTPGRDAVAPFYSEYSFARREPGYAPEFENTLMMFRPLFGTSWLLETFCEDHNFFGADRVVISSASAKTSMGFGHLLKKNHGDRVKAIGLTSARNREFVTGLDCYDQVLTYDEIGSLENGGCAVFFDVAGNQNVLARVHEHLGESIVYSGQVGQTHWEAGDGTPNAKLPGAKPVFWSGPDQVMKLRERLGEANMGRQMQARMIDFMLAAHNWITTVPAEGPQAVEARIKSMLEGEINADEGVVLMP